MAESECQILVNVVMDLVKQRLTDFFIQKWNAEINDSTQAGSYKLDLYIQFKLKP